MSGISSIAVVSYLSQRNGEPATQRMISDDLGISQASVSRILRETPGIIANEQVRPVLYSFDPTAIVTPMTTESKPNDTGVIRPDGRYMIGNALFERVPDTLSERPWEALVKGADSMFGTIAKESLGSYNKKELMDIARQLDNIAITIRCRVEKGDFDG